MTTTTILNDARCYDLTRRNKSKKDRDRHSLDVIYQWYHTYLPWEDTHKILWIVGVLNESNLNVLCLGCSI